MPTSEAPSGSMAGGPVPARVTLPGNLPEALKYLDDAQLQKLLDAVAAEIKRRRQAAPQKPVNPAPSTVTSSPGKSKAGHDTNADRIDEVPQGKANLIRASFKAGLKPAVIARTFGISQSAISRILGSLEKSKG
jgi:DNA invertase Pin-like site-specific DNA recombinase